MELVGKILLGILCYGVLIVLIIVFYSLLCAGKYVMQDFDFGIFLKIIYVLSVVVSYISMIVWIIISAHLLGLF